MQSIFRAQHAFQSCSLHSLPLKARCSLACSAPRAWEFARANQGRSVQTEAPACKAAELPNEGQITGSKLDGRRRLSSFWTPTGGIEVTGDAKDDSHSLLIRGGFLRQAHAGLFQLLPLGLRIQEKLERLLDKHMTAMGASKVALSTLSSQELWRKTGRMRVDGSSSPEIFQVLDRKEAKYILSPTHEEEITSLVGVIVKSYKELPLRLYQITRKYRDEARPRQGLLRTREFLMKDLYTFDASAESALESYETVRKAYSAFFGEIKVPYLVAKAASGDMGGDLSHEFHFPTVKGEDNIVSCNTCDYVANEELAERRESATRPILDGTLSVSDQRDLIDFADSPLSSKGLYRQWFGIAKDRRTLIQAIYPSKKAFLAADIEVTEEPQINPSVVQDMFPGLDIDLSVENPLDKVQSGNLFRIYDTSIKPPADSSTDSGAVREASPLPPSSVGLKDTVSPIYKLHQRWNDSHDVYEIHTRRSLLKIASNDPCAHCPTGRLRIQPAIELGHTFHLGTRYTKPLNATIATKPPHNGSSARTDAAAADDDDDALDSNQAYLQMGCHGIGVSRLIGAVADALVDEKGLNWPRVMAPFEAVVVPAKNIGEDAAREVYDALVGAQGGGSSEPLDVILDDRSRDFGWKLRDADGIGYPVIVVIGRGWKAGRQVEVQCRRLGWKEQVPLAEVKGVVERLLERL